MSILRKITVIVGLLLAIPAVVDAQCTIRGKVVDENGESLPGVVVTLKFNKSLGTVTDFDGDYSLKVPDSTDVVVVYSMIGLQPKEERIAIVKNSVVIRNITLTASAQEIKEVEITGKAVRSNDYYFETIKKKSAATIDYISADVIKKIGDNNVTAAIARVPGVSTNGAMITVRGIGDRYVKTSINGSRIPTLDPFTNNIKLDLFPTGLVDNIVITKTASPDLPGDWAGAYISVETKDYPDQFSLNVESSIGFNAQSTFRDVITSDRSRTDWLGFDNSLRGRDHSGFNYAYITPTTYQEMVALGLGSYYNSLGVNQSNWGEGTAVGETYFKLGLVKLGLLPSALINDPVAFANAVSLYNSGSYRDDAFNVINAPAAATGQSFSNNWNTYKRQAPLNYSQSFSVGNQSTLFGKTFGYLFGFRYGSNVVYDPASTIAKAGVAQGPNGELVNVVSSRANQEIGRETDGWSALLNLSMKLNPNHSVSFMAMPNFNGFNNIRFATDRQDYTNYVITNSQYYEQRKQMVYQLNTQHYFPGVKLKADFSSSFTRGLSSAPDFKNVQYYLDPISNVYQIGGAIGDGIHRYYRYLSDNVFDNKIRFEKPFFEKEGLIRKLIFGGGWESNAKESNQYDYFINLGPYTTLNLQDNDLDALFEPSHFALSTYVDQFGQSHSTMDCYYGVFNTPANNTFGRSDIYSAFLMSDYGINTRWRVSGGIRLEKAEIYTDVVLFDSLGYAANDPRRSYSSSYPLANPGELSETNYLPSINLIHKLKDSEESPMNLRFNFSQTVARPSIRELSDIAQLDYEYRVFVFGNSDLKTVHIDNYDMRWEYFLKSGTNLSASIFYKKFRNHIEMVRSVGLTWQNVDDSYVAGLELEGRKKIAKSLELRANVTLVYSRTEFVRKRLDLSDGVKIYYPLDTLIRPMFGQSPYVFNTILTYSLDNAGITITGSYNIQGPRLVIAADVKEIPDIYELPRHLFDIKASKTLGKRFTVSASVKDLFNAPIRRAYKYPEGFTLDFDRFRFGSVYQLSLAYKI